MLCLSWQSLEGTVIEGRSSLRDCEIAYPQSFGRRNSSIACCCGRRFLTTNIAMSDYHDRRSIATASIGLVFAIIVLVFSIGQLVLGISPKRSYSSSRLTQCPLVSEIWSIFPTGMTIFLISLPFASGISTILNRIFRVCFRSWCCKSCRSCWKRQCHRMLDLPLFGS
jgi:hypothetical protein